MRSAIRVVTLIVVLVLSEGSGFAALPETDSPELVLERTIRTTPFTGSAVHMKDGEGSAFVPSDNSLWLTEDNGRRVYEVNPDAGTLKRVIRRARFESVHQFGGGPAAGADRTRDFESMAYDAANDDLYLFSGPCCDPSSQPTVFRLVRNQAGRFRVESYQPLPAAANYTGAAWSALQQQLYLGVGKQLRTYDYESNTSGLVFNVPGLANITGMVFSSGDLFVTTSSERLRRVDWASKTLVPGWTFDLTSFGVLDSRAVEVIGDRFHVLDGADQRPRGHPLRFAVFVFDVLP